MMTRVRSLAATLIVAMATLLALPPSPTTARPTDAEIAPVKDAINKKIKVQFLETPLRRAIETLQRESGVTFVIDKEGIAGLDDKPVSLEAEAMTIEAALDWACRVTGTDWEVRGGVIVIASQKTIALRSRVTKVYDISGLLIHIPDFLAPSFDVNDALSNTNSGGSGEHGVARAATTLFAADDTGPTLTREEMIEQITTLIQDTVGRQDEWAAYGGNVGSLRELNSRLVVQATPQNHEQIAKLLDDLHAALDRLVTVEARYLLVKSESVEKLLAANNGSLVLDEKQTAALLAELAKAEHGAKRIGGSRTTCFNGQRVYVSTGPVATFISDIEPVPSTAGIDPTLSVLRGGNVIDVQPTINYKGDGVVITFRSDVVIDTSLTTSTIPTGGADDGIHIDATGKLKATATEPKPDAPGTVNGNVKTDGRLVAANAGAAGSVELEKPAQDLVLYRSSITVPDGGAVIFTGSSNLLKASQKEDTEVVMILRARIRTMKK